MYFAERGMFMFEIVLASTKNGYIGGYGLGGFRMYFDPTYILVLIGVVISLIASARVKSTFARYQRERARCGLTGAEVAERIMRANGIYDVRVNMFQVVLLTIMILQGKY